LLLLPEYYIHFAAENAALLKTEKIKGNNTDPGGMQVQACVFFMSS
jgi:hypothetical protein